MTRGEHVRLEDLLALRDKGLDAVRLTAVLDHVAGCSSCATLAGQALSLDRAGRSLLEQLDLDAAADRLDLESENVRAARRSLEPKRSARPRWWFAAAAAAFLILGGVFLAGRRATAPAPAPLPESLRAALQRGTLAPPPAYLAVLPSAHAFRGEGNAGLSEIALGPAGDIVEEERPTFSWTAQGDGRYVVSVYEDKRLVAQSETLHRTSWIVPRDLARDGTYVWQVSVVRHDEVVAMLPPAPPPPQFRILSQSDHETLERARKDHPQNHLLLGVLYAERGLRERADRELQIAAADPRTADAAKPLLASVRHWPRTR